ncbi:MAG: hypothetical protein AB8H03_08815 [Saprospiraceae bacterium]
MKKITHSTFLLILLLGFSFCKVQEYTPTDYPKSQIIFGSGGGITGAVNETFIFDNGKVFSKNGLDTNYVALKTLKSQVVEQVFSNVESLNLRKINMDKPGNMYNFIRIKDKDVDHQIVWSEKNEETKEIIKFYAILKHLTKVEKQPNN